MSWPPRKASARRRCTTGAASRERGVGCYRTADAGPEGWSTADKFATVVETAALNAAELGEYCRQRGRYPQQVQAWRGACEQANDWEQERARQARGEEAAQRRRIRALERELKHKEKALAEAAALLVLSKKAAAIWGEDGDA